MIASDAVAHAHAHHASAPELYISVSGIPLPQLSPISRSFLPRWSLIRQNPCAEDGTAAHYQQVETNVVDVRCAGDSVEIFSAVAVLLDRVAIPITRPTLLLAVLVIASSGQRSACPSSLTWASACCRRSSSRAA